MGGTPLSKTASNRSFAFLLFAVCFVVAAMTKRNGGIPVISGGLAFVFLAIAVMVPRVLAPAKRLWLRAAGWRRVVVGPLALGLMYAAVVVPVGLLVRLFGKDLLSLKLDSAAETYWIARKGGGPASQSLTEPY